MGNPIPKEKRRGRRRALTGLLPGTLLGPSGESINARPVDVTAVGLGIVTDATLKPGTILFLRTHNLHIELEVSWSRPDFGKNQMVRYGLETKDQSNLEQVFVDAGCLR